MSRRGSRRARVGDGEKIEKVSFMEFGEVFGILFLGGFEVLLICGGVKGVKDYLKYKDKIGNLRTQVPKMRAEKQALEKQVEQLQKENYSLKKGVL